MPNTTSIDLSLDRIRKLLTFLPGYTRPTIHIAGTNGKGSVSSLLSSIFHSSHISFGRFNSPHLVAVHDCITINGRTVNFSLYTEAWRLVRQANDEHGVGASEFELLTSTAMLIFELEKVEVVVLEVGMGGRLDATNVVRDECVLVDALASVDLDHQAILGHTVEEIAREKARIARRGKPFVLGRQRYAEVVSAVREEVLKVGGDVVDVWPVRRREWDPSMDDQTPSDLDDSFDFRPSKFRKPRPQAVELVLPCFLHPVKALLPLYGDHQLDNLAIAATVISTLLTHPSCAERASSWSARLTAETLAAGIKATDWPGRLSFHSLPVSALDYVPSPDDDGGGGGGGGGGGHRPSEDNGGKRITVLADGAHNPASSSTLASYISHLLSSATPTNASSSSTHRPRTIYLTYIIALSHSPPKTPLQTLSHLLSLPSPSHSITAPPLPPQPPPPPYPVSSTSSSNAQTPATSPRSNSVKSLSPSPPAGSSASQAGSPTMSPRQSHAQIQSQQRSRPTSPRAPPQALVNTMAQHSSSSGSGSGSSSSMIAPVLPTSFNFSTYPDLHPSSINTTSTTNTTNSTTTNTASVPTSTSTPTPPLQIRTSVACLRFSPVEGMPWVRPVSPSELRRTVRRVVPDAEVWTEDDGGERGMTNGVGNRGGMGEGMEGVEGMRRALRWAAGRMRGRIGDDGGGGGAEGGGGEEGEEEEGEEEEGEKEEEGLVVVAGSLYLVADFYRLIGSWSSGSE